MARHGNATAILVDHDRSTAALMIYYQDGAGALWAATRVASYDIPGGARIADLDGDGRSDIVVFHDAFVAVGVYFQQPGGTLAAEQRCAAPYGGVSGPDTLSVGDVTHDGGPDIIAMGALIRQFAGPGSMSLVARAEAAVRRIVMSRLSAASADDRRRRRRLGGLRGRRDG